MHVFLYFYNTKDLFPFFFLKREDPFPFQPFFDPSISLTSQNLNHIFTVNFFN